MRKNKGLWLGLIAVLLLCGVVALGPAVGRAIGQEAALSMPRALLSMYIGQQKVTPLTADGRKIVGRQGPGPGERALTAFMSGRGWAQEAVTITPQRAAHAGNPVAVDGHTDIIYKKDGVLLNAMGRFRSGLWWYELDKTP
jgi:hypothetical protein